MLVYTSTSVPLRDVAYGYVRVPAENVVLERHHQRYFFMFLEYGDLPTCVSKQGGGHCPQLHDLSPGADM
jgi:hypothetical protein